MSTFVIFSDFLGHNIFVHNVVLLWYVFFFIWKKLGSLVREVSKVSKNLFRFFQANRPNKNTPIWGMRFLAFYTVFRASRVTFFLVNRVKNQNKPKRPKSGGCLGSFWFSTLLLADTGTDYNLHHAFSSEPSWIPKRTQTATKWWPFGFVLVFNSIH